MDTSLGGKWLVRKHEMGRPSWWWACGRIRGTDLGFHNKRFCHVQPWAILPYVKLSTLRGKGSLN